MVSAGDSPAARLALLAPNVGVLLRLFDEGVYAPSA